MILEENLPNVTIDNILLDNIQESESYKIVVNVSIKINDKANRWIDDDFFVKHLNLILVKSSNTLFNERATTGGLMISASSIKQYSLDDPDSSIELYEVPISMKRDIIKKNDEAVFTFEMQQHHSATDLRLFSMTSVDMSTLCVQYGGDPMVGDSKAYYGAITSEAIIREGAVVNTATLLELQGSPYSGPVHLHNGTYMVGSQHTSSPHSTLTAVQVPNLKLKDNRTVNYSSINKISPQIKNHPIVSELYTTFGSNATLKGLFSVNVEQLLLSKTKYGKTFYNLRQAEYNNLLASMFIKSIKLYKKRVRVGKRSKKVSKVMSTKMIASSKDVKSENVLNSMYLYDLKSVSHGQESLLNIRREDLAQYDLEQYNHVSTIKQESLFDQNKIRTFSFVDAQVNTNASFEYAYAIKIEFVDGSIPFLYDMIKKINSSILNLERYIYICGLRANYNFETKKLKNSIVNELIAQFDRTPWTDAPAVYAKYFSILNNLSITEQERLAQKYSVFLFPETFNLMSAKMFLSKFKEFSYHFMKKFNVSRSKIQGSTVGRGQKIFQNKNTSDILLEHDFANTVKFSDIDLGFQILDLEDTGELSTITLEEFEVQITEENGKYFDGKVGLSKDEISALTDDEYKSYANYEKYRVTYISPKSIKKGKNTIMADLSNISSVDHKLVSSFSKMKKTPSIHKPSFWMKPYTVKTLSIDAINKQSDEQGDIDYIPAEKYFGADSNFITTDNIEDKENIPTAYSSMSAPIVQPLLASSMNSFANFDIMEGNVKITDDLPNQIKSIIGSRSPSAKNSFLGSDVDALKVPETADSVEMMFFSLQRIMYCDGFLPTNGDTIEPPVAIKKPIWKVLDSTALQGLSGDVLCKTEYYEPSGLNVTASPDNRFNVFNNLFILSTPVVTQTAPASSLTTSATSGYETGIRDISLARTNIITQPMKAAEMSLSSPSAPTGMGTNTGGMGTNTGGSYGY